MCVLKFLKNFESCPGASSSLLSHEIVSGGAKVAPESLFSIFFFHYV